MLSVPIDAWKIVILLVTQGINSLCLHLCHFKTKVNWDNLHEKGQGPCWNWTNLCLNSSFELQRKKDKRKMVELVINFCFLNVHFYCFECIGFWDKTWRKEIGCWTWYICMWLEKGSWDRLVAVADFHFCENKINTLCWLLHTKQNVNHWHA